MFRIRFSDNTKDVHSAQTLSQKPHCHVRFDLLVVVVFLSGLVETWMKEHGYEAYAVQLLCSLPLHSPITLDISD